MLQVELLFTAGGAPGYLATTEKWDGTSWTEVADLATARSEIRGGGTSALGIAMSGSIPGSPSYSAATEEWNDPVYSIKTVTVS